MKCENCKATLNPFMLKQAGYVNDELTFEVECIKCRKYNTLSMSTYFFMKRDYEMPKMAPINMKLPSDLNVMIVSMQRCGISWIVRELSILHQKTFGKKEVINLNNTEVSFVQATRTRFPVYKGWSNVYDVNPLDLLKTKDNGEKYDRVLIVKRKWDTIRKVHEIYYPDDLGEDQKVRWREKDKEIYDKVYNQEIDDPRCMTVNLEDLNNYTVATFDELMDFFNFPDHIQPAIAPILAPERNSEAYSSILEKGQPLIKRLTTIASFYEVTLDGLLQLKNEKQRLSDKNVKHPKLKNILVIGPRILRGCHFSENIYYALKQKGYNVIMQGVEDLGYHSFEGKKYKSYKELYPISKAVDKLDFRPELIIMDEPAWLFYNDVDIPVFYVQREFKRPPKCFYPTIAFFWHKHVINYFKTIFAPHWVANTPRLETIGIAVDPKRFKYKNIKKTIKGIVALGGRERVSALDNMREITGLGILYDLKHQLKKVFDLGIPFIGDENETLTDEAFRETLPKCEATWVHVPLGQYLTRRMLEAMLCKTVCFMRIENETHEEILREMGFISNKHYIPIKDVSEIVEYNKSFKYNDFKDMVDSAYKVVMERHTYSNKADELIRHYNEWAFKLRGLIVE